MSHQACTEPRAPCVALTGLGVLGAFCARTHTTHVAMVNAAERPIDAKLCAQHARKLEHDGLLHTTPYGLLWPVARPGCDRHADDVS